MVRPQKEMVGCFNIIASLDHLDYDCVVADSVHLLSVRSGHFGMRSKHTFASGESRNESIPRFTVGHLQKVPVRYRPNAASGGWSYGRDHVHCRAARETRLTSSYLIFIRQLRAGSRLAVVL